MPGKNLGNQGVINLVQQGQLQGCQTLNLWDNKISDAGALALARCPDIKELKVLQLGWNRIGPAGAIAIAESPYLQNLEELLLYHNDVEDKGAQAIIGSQSWQLRSLNMCNNQLTKKIAADIVTASHFKNLHSLHLGCNDLMSEGLHYLLQLPNLKELNLRLNNIRGAQLTNISLTPHSQLDYLGIEDNPITSDGLHSLVRQDILKKTKILNLIECQLTPDSIKHLASSETTLEEIRLGGNLLGDEGLKNLISGGFIRQIKKLHLQWNNISSLGVAALCQSKNLDNLCYLNLQGNNLDTIDIQKIRTIFSRMELYY